MIFLQANVLVDPLSVASKVIQFSHKRPVGLQVVGSVLTGVLTESVLMGPSGVTARPLVQFIKSTNCPFCLRSGCASPSPCENDNKQTPVTGDPIPGGLGLLAWLSVRNSRGMVVRNP